MTTVRLVLGGGPVDAMAMGCDREPAPALLVSYAYLSKFQLNRHRFKFRDWVMDSGAYSAHNSGKTIVHQDYLDTCRQFLKDDPTLKEVFSLDVIGDAEASLKNTEEAWRQGIPVIPTYHIGEPDEFLIEMARKYPKISIGGVVGYPAKHKLRWADQVFARVWPKKIHGLGFGSAKIVERVPFHSVDASNWEVSPTKFGRWQSFGILSWRGSNQNLRIEVEYYLKLEHRARERWAKQMAQLDGEPNQSPTVRLAVANAASPRTGLEAR